MSDHAPQEKIYLTYKTRMTTEARLRKTALTLHLLLSWYSFCLIVLSILDISNKFEIYYSSMISVAASVLIFSLSLFIYGERYSERADQFRNCYLKLKSLYETTLDVDKKMQIYAEILNQYENQSDKDYDEMLFDAYLRNQQLRNAKEVVRITFVVFVKIFFRRIIYITLTFAFFVAPVVAGILLIHPLAKA